MDETMDKKRPLSDLMRSTMDKIREMADTNTIVGQPITTPDGVTLIPISRVSMGFGCGGADYGKTQPVAFLVIREGTTRVLPVAMPPMTTLDRVVEMMPDLVDKVEKYVDTKDEKEPVCTGYTTSTKQLR